MIVYTSLRAAVWEYLNSNRDIRELVKPIVSSLSTLNTTYSIRKEEYQQTLQLSQLSPSTTHQSPPQYLYHTDTFQTSEEYNLERWIIYNTYIPSPVVISCIRSLCLQLEIELNLINKLNNYIKINNSNLIKNNLINDEESTNNSPTLVNYHILSQNPHLIQENYIKFMKPTNINYILVKDLISFLCNDDNSNEKIRNDISKIILNEFKKLQKLIKNYFYKTTEKK